MSIARQTEIMSVGHCGGTVITDTVIHRGAWRLIVPYEATVIAALAGPTSGTELDGNTIIGETIATNFHLYGAFTEITLTSGACVAYK